MTPCPVCPPSPLTQFHLLHSKFHLCSVPTRALLLSTYIKFVNLFPEVKGTIQDVLRSDSQLKNADVELQQRAVEYLRLSTVASTDILVRHAALFPPPRLGRPVWGPGAMGLSAALTQGSFPPRRPSWRRCLRFQNVSLLSWPSSRRRRAPAR